MKTRMVKKIKCLKCICDGKLKWPIHFPCEKPLPCPSLCLLQEILVDVYTGSF